LAMFGNQKFLELEERYDKGVEIKNGENTFKLTLIKKTHDPNIILDYDWKVTLSDGTEFLASMGSHHASYPPTRLESIIEKLKDASRYDNSYLANAINDQIDEIYRQYK
jgi:hypothetical protein